MRYRGNDPEGFAPATRWCASSTSTATSSRRRVRTGVTVRAVRPKPGASRLLVRPTAGRTRRRTWSPPPARIQEPVRRRSRPRCRPRIVQVHLEPLPQSRRAPARRGARRGLGRLRLPDRGGLARAGRTVYLGGTAPARAPPPRPRRLLVDTRDGRARPDRSSERPDARQTPNPLVTGVGGGHDIDIRDYARPRRGPAGPSARRPGTGASTSTTTSTRSSRRATWRHAARSGSPRTSTPRRVRAPASGPRTRVRALARAPAAPTSPTRSSTSCACRHHQRGLGHGLSRRTSAGSRLPALDDAGEPVHRRGVTACAGLYFLGLPWLHKLKSSVLCGVGEDAQHLAERIAAR